MLAMAAERFSAGSGSEVIALGRTQRRKRRRRPCPTAAIIGASRGIGLGLARQYAASGWRVYATTRTPDDPGALGEVRG